MRLVLALIVFVSACQQREDPSFADPPPKPIDHDVLLPLPTTNPPSAEAAPSTAPPVLSGGGRITIEVASGRACIVLFDGRRLPGETPLQITDLDAHEHDVTVRCPGRSEVSKRVAANATEPTLLRFDEPPASAMP